VTKLAILFVIGAAHVLDRDNVSGDTKLKKRACYTCRADDQAHIDYAKQKLAVENAGMEVHLAFSESITMCQLSDPVTRVFTAKGELVPA
jgi:hypothetical protein